MKITEQIDYRRMCCASCGVIYFFSEDWCKRATEEGKSWCCPNGHSQWFGESQLDKMRQERDRLKREKLDLNPRKCGDWAKHDDIRKSQTLGYCPNCGERMRKG